MIVTIDGPSGVGKGTLAKRLAAHFGWDYLDSGALYRAVAARALADGVDLSDGGALARLAAKIDPASLDNPRLRDEVVSQAASKVAADSAVRSALLKLQRDFAHHPPGRAGAVLDGRDMGTVVCPEADVKLFLTADAETRVERRWRQLQAEGEAPERSAVAAALAERDGRDAGRDVSPLRPAEDAHLLDTTNLDIDGTFQAAKAIVADCLTRRGDAGDQPPG